jgi:hypothetical protein
LAGYGDARLLVSDVRFWGKADISYRRFSVSFSLGVAFSTRKNFAKLRPHFRSWEGSRKTKEG